MLDLLWEYIFQNAFILLAHCCLGVLTALFNPFDNLGDDHPSLNLFSCRFSSVQLSFEDFAMQVDASHAHADYWQSVDTQHKAPTSATSTPTANKATTSNTTSFADLWRKYKAFIPAVKVVICKANIYLNTEVDVEIRNFFVEADFKKSMDCKVQLDAFRVHSLQQRSAVQLPLVQIEDVCLQFRQQSATTTSNEIKVTTRLVQFSTARNTDILLDYARLLAHLSLSNVDLLRRRFAKQYDRLMRQLGDQSTDVSMFTTLEEDSQLFYDVTEIQSSGSVASSSKSWKVAVSLEALQLVTAVGRIQQADQVEKLCVDNIALETNIEADSQSSSMELNASIGDISCRTFLWVEGHSLQLLQSSSADTATSSSAALSKLLTIQFHQATKKQAQSSEMESTQSLRCDVSSVMLPLSTVSVANLLHFSSELASIANIAALTKDKASLTFVHQGNHIFHWESVDIAMERIALRLYAQDGAQKHHCHVLDCAIEAIRSVRGQDQRLTVEVPNITCGISSVNEQALFVSSPLAAAVNVKIANCSFSTALGGMDENRHIAPNTCCHTVDQWQQWAEEQQKESSNPLLTCGSISVHLNQHHVKSLGRVLGQLMFAPKQFAFQPTYHLISFGPCKYSSMNMQLQSVEMTLDWDNTEESTVANADVDDEGVSCYRYKIMKHQSCSVLLTSLGTYWSESYVSIQKNISIRLKKHFRDPTKAPEEKLLLRVNGGNGEKIKFRSKTTIGDVFVSKEKGVGVGHHTSCSTCTVSALTAALDTKDINPLLFLIRDWGSGSALAYNEAFTYLADEVDVETATLPKVSTLLPSSTFLFHIEHWKLTFFHLCQPVVSLRGQQLEYAGISFSEALEQTCLSMSSIEIAELTADYAVHKVLVDSVEPSFPNKILLHVTSKHGEFGLMEVHGEYLRVSYLQRPTLTLVCYFLDYLIADIKRNLTDLSVRRKQRQLMRIRPVSGMFRVSAVVKKSEVHLPTNSCCTDALVVVFHQLQMFLSNDQMRQHGAINSYCTGPYIEKKMWISELNNIKRQLQKLHSSTANYLHIKESENADLDINWKLPRCVADLECPVNVAYTLDQKGSINLELFDASLCSWCNHTAICHQQDITSQISVVSAYPNSDEVAQEEFEGELYDIAPAEARNTIYVGVQAKEVDWMLTQGQYWAIVNLIQQNFSELQLLVDDIFQVPTPLQVDVDENLFGKYSLVERLPLINTVPINIAKGRIIAAQNESTFYDMFMMDLPAPEICEEEYFHDVHQYLTSAIPANAHHHRHREACFNRWQVTTRKQADKGKDKTTKSKLRASDVIDPITPFCITFEKLFVDFYRKHFGGGNGIEVAADCFIISAHEHEIFVKTDTDNNPLPSKLSTANFDALHVRTTILAPKDAQWLTDQTSRKQRVDPVEPSVASERPSELRPHIRYHQQGVANLRRCVVEIEESAFVIHLSVILTIVDFFHTPIRVNGSRNLKLIQEMGVGPYDWRIGLDVEVYLQQTVLCLPNVNDAEESNGLCFSVDLSYLHAWRGFMEAGPGKESYSILSKVYGTFIAPINEVKDIHLVNLVEPVNINFVNETFAWAPEHNASVNLDILRPWVRLGDWVNKANHLSRASGKTSMKLSIFPLRQAVQDDDQLEEDEYGDEDGGEARSRRMKERGHDQHETEDEYKQAMEEDKVVKEVVRGQCSLKDVEFILSVINCFRKGLKRHLKNIPMHDAYGAISSSTFDVQHLPPLMYHLLHVAEGEGFKVDVKDFTADVCDFQFHVKNNTYNLNMLRCSLQDICMIYDRIPTHLHMAAGVKVAVWTFNDHIDEWEPLIEPIQMRAIGATDSSQKELVTSLRDSSKVRVEVMTDALEVNASQVALTNLLRKMKLNDVVTTSSQKLPPYKIINELGVAVAFQIGYNGRIVVANTINEQEQIPIEVNQLESALNKFKDEQRFMYHQDEQTAISGGGSKEYLLAISFQNLKDTYDAAEPLSIDKVGITPFDMRVSNAKKQQNSKMFSWLGFGGHKAAENAPAAETPAPAPMDAPESIRRAPSVDDETAVLAPVAATPTIKFVQEIPLTLLDMRIKGDGVRELHMKSILSFRNSTSRLFHVSLHLYGSSVEHILLPGKEWNVPVRYANPRTSLFLRFDGRMPWKEVVPTLANFISQGYWGSPQRLRADVSLCPGEFNEVTEDKWVLLMRPEAKHMKGTLAAGGKNVIPIRYPTKDTFSKKVANDLNDINTGNSEEAHAVASSMTLSQLRTKLNMLRPLCVHFQAPMQLCNLLPQPLLYRLAYSDGSICGTGTILPGQIIDVHKIDQIFSSRIFVSVRMLNYGWSKWSVAYTRSSPFFTNEKNVDLTLNSLHFVMEDKEHTLPTLDVTMSIKEFLIRFTCQVILSNCTGMELCFAESSNTDTSIPISSSDTIEKYVDNVTATSTFHRNAMLPQQRMRRNNYIDLNVAGEDEDDDEDDGDDTGDDSTRDSLSSAMHSEASTENKVMSPPPSYLSSKLDILTESGTGKLTNVTIHLPHDHTRKLELIANTSWTFADLFQQIRSKLSAVSAHIDSKDYIFFPWVKSSANVKASIEESQETDNNDAAAAPTAEADNAKESKKNNRSEVPEFMKFGMIMDLSCEAFSMQSTLDKISSTAREIFLCHRSEVTIYNQASNIRIDAIEREGLFRSVFGRTKFSHRANFVKIVGDCPFRPHRILGFHPMISLSLPNEDQWSTGIDAIKGDFDVGELTVSTFPKSISAVDKDTALYEFGAFVERGRGILHNTTTVTFVPKHVLVSKLAFDVEVSVVDYAEPSINQSASSGTGVSLLANTSKSFYFPLNSKSRLLHIRRGNYTAAASSNAEDFSESWMGEVDASTLGIVYIKLRNPLVIIQVETEIVGASFIVSFKEQNLLWPPYRLSNMTESLIRFRQTTADGNASSGIFSSMMSTKTTTANSAEDAQMKSLPSDESLATPANTNKDSQQVDNTRLPWDSLQPRTTCSFAWDYPLTGIKMLQLEVAQGNQWVPKTVSLDDESKLEAVIMKRGVPNLGNPLAEGKLFKFDTVTDNWTEVYCILKPDVMYVYNDESRSTLTDVLSFSLPTEEGPKFGVVTKYSDKGWDLLGTIQSSVGFIGAFMGSSQSSSSKSSRVNFDTNSVRVLMLRVADQLGIFSHCTAETFNSHKRRQQVPDSDDELEAEQADAITPQKDVDPAVPTDGGSLRLKDFLAMGVSIEQLLEEIANVPIRLNDVYRVLFDEGHVSSSEQAAEVCQWMMRESFLAEHENHHERFDSINDQVWSDSEKLSSQIPSHILDRIEEMGGGGEGNDDEDEEDESDVDSDVEAMEAGKRSRSHEEEEEGDDDIITHTVSSASHEEDNSSSAVDATTSRKIKDKESVSPSRRGRLTFSLNISSAKKPSSKMTFEQVLHSMEQTELFFHPPPLNPEMSAMFALDNMMETSRASGVYSSNSNNNNGSANDEIHGFSVVLPGNVKYHFRCGSEMEYFGWIQSCRRSIELSWMDFELERKTKDSKPICIDDFQSKILMKVRPDGSTKVLEIVEDENVEKEESSNSLLSKSTRFVSKTLLGKKAGTKKMQQAQAASILPLFAKSRQYFSGHGASQEDLLDNVGEIDREQQLISASFAVQAVSLSIMDHNPVELAYVRLQDIDMSVIRYFDAVQFSVTVREIQMSDQLMHSSFPVALSARKQIANTSTGAAQSTEQTTVSGRKLMLPGLDTSKISGYPSLHLYLQQRYHHLSHSNPEAAAKYKAARKNDTKLWYFDAFTLWLAPLNLGLNEESVVRLMRYAHAVKASLSKDEESSKSRKLREDVAVIPNKNDAHGNQGNAASSATNAGATGAVAQSAAHDTNWLQSELSPNSVHSIFSQFLASGKKPYASFRDQNKSMLHVYFNVLQLHPLDVALTFRTSPELQITNAELAIISIISQLDGARLRLNALIAENAYGSNTLITDILSKHYRTSFWKQFHHLIGAGDAVDDSVGLVANLGGGVYDLYYEPIDGLTAENNSFLNGLQKGGVSLASKAIGNTSAIASKITGGIGKGVSLLTLDSEFQRHRSYRRYNKASSVAEGLYVGTQELGKNIMEGVTGIVVSPYRGWEQGGGVGFGVGVAKGILGVALKPAAGVFDLASRATEGIRNTALSVDPALAAGMQTLHRARLPRAFGRAGQLHVYDVYAAASQYIADALTGFKQDNRLQVVSHLYSIRKVINSPLYNAMLVSSRSKAYDHELVAPKGEFSAIVKTALTIKKQQEHSVEIGNVVIDELTSPAKEAWGLRTENYYITLITPDRVTLIQVSHEGSGPKSYTSTTNSVCNNKRKSVRKFIWSCPAACIDQLYSDPRGDLVLSISNSLHITGSWNQATNPAIMDLQYQNYIIFQSLLEQTIGCNFARQQPLHPWKGILQCNIRKRYATGIRSYLLSPSSHTYRVFGNVLYEYTTASKPNRAESADQADPTAVGNNADNNPLRYQQEQITNSEEFAENLVSRLFPPKAHRRRSVSTNVLRPIREADEEGNNNANSHQAHNANNEDDGEDITTNALLQDHYLSFVYPLVDLYMTGPHPEDNGKQYSISLARVDNQKMRVLKRDDDNDLFQEYLKNGLSLIFPTMENALQWRHAIESRIIFRAQDVVPVGPLTTEDRKKALRGALSTVTGRKDDMSIAPPADNSILGCLVLPTSGCSPEDTERIKIEIARTLSNVRRT